MSNTPPKRFHLASSQKPHADFNWPLTDEEVAQSRLETLQRLYGYVDSRPTDDEPLPSAVEPLHSAVEKPHPDVNPPPTDEELTEGGIATVQGQTVFSGAAAKRAEPFVAGATLAADATSAVPDASSELWDARFDRPPGTEVPTPPEAEHPEYAGTDGSPEIAVAPNETAIDETSAGDWAAEIARLQALIEGLTEQV